MTREGEMGYRAPVFLAVVAAALFSMAVFMGSVWGKHFDDALGRMLAQTGLGIGGNTLIILALVFSVVAAIRVEKRISWPIRISWSLYLPSTLYYSRVDLANLVGGSFDYSVFGNSFPGAVVLLNGLVLMAATLLSRSYLGVSGIRLNLLGRGADRAEVDAVCSRNMGFLLPLIAGPCVLALLLWFLYGAISSGDLLAGLVGTGAYRWVSAIAVLALFALFAYAFVGRGEPGDAGD